MKRSNDKKKSQLIRFNIDGGVVLGGVALLGGGLAVAGLIAAFSIIKNRNSGKDYKKQEDSTAAAATPSDKIHEGSQGLSFVLHNPSTAVHQNSCCTSHGAKTIGVTESLMDSTELLATHNMPLGEKTLPIIDGEKEMLTSDELKKEINELCNEILNNEASVKMIKSSGENLRPMENTEIKRREDPAETEKLAVEENLPMEFVKNEEQEHGEDDDDDGSEERVVEKEEEIAEGELARKENSPVQSIEEEEGDDDDDNNNHSSEEEDSEDVTEKEEESSEGTGSSSVESNVEAIWPTEMIEALSRELKEIDASNQNSGEKKIAKPESHDFLNRRSVGSMFNEYGSNNVTTRNSAMINKKTTQELGTEKVEHVSLPKREVLVWSLLLVILLLLLLHIHRTMSVHDLSYEKSIVGPQV